MSAFIVQDETINKIISCLETDREAAHWRNQLKTAGYDLDTPDRCKKLGWDMFALNIRSVNQRYPDRSASDLGGLNYKYQYKAANRYQVLKSLQCWLYQSCEGDCNASDLYKLFEEISHSMALNIIADMPEYELAKWG